MNLASIVRTGPVLIFGIIWVVQFFQEPDPETQTQSLQEKKKRERVPNFKEITKGANAREHQSRP